MKRVGLLLLAYASQALAAAPGDGAVAAATAALQARLGAGAKAQITVTARPNGAELTGTTFRAEPIEGRLPRSRLSVTVEACSPGHHCHAEMVGFALSVDAPVLVYGGDAASHAAASMLAVESRDGDAARGHDLVASMDDVKGLRLRHAVRAGQPVSRDDFEAIPDVDNREQVRLVADVGAITIESRGMAMHAGNRGDVVPVVVAGASEPVRGVVTERGVVHVAR